MARRLKAKDKLVRKRVRGALVEENMRTKKRRKVGKRETEQELVRSEALLDQEEQGGIRGERSASKRLNRSIEGTQPGRARSGSAKAKAAMKRLHHDADEQREILKSSRTDSKRRMSNSTVRAAGNEEDSRFFLDEDELLDEDALSWEDDLADSDSNEDTGKRNSIYRHHLKSGERFRDAERDTRSIDRGDSEVDDVELEDEKDGEAETGLKARKQRLRHQMDGFRDSDAADEASDETAKERKQRLRHQAETLREAEAAEEAAKETFEELTDAEVSRTEGIAAVKKKSRLNHSDESGALRMVNGAGRMKDKIEPYLLSHGIVKRRTDNGKMEPVARVDLTRHTDLEIVSTYDAELRGLCNFYYPASNYRSLNYFSYLMEYSCLKTLAWKHRCKLSKIYDKYRTDTKRWGVPYETKSGRKIRRLTKFNEIDGKKCEDIMPVIVTIIATVKTTLDDRLKACRCELCGHEGNDRKYEIHHVNKVKNLKGKTQWEQVMIAKRRKTLVVCYECHRKIHRGC